MSEKSWFDTLSEVLSKPLPGTDSQEPTEIEKPVVFTDDHDDDSLLDKITDIPSRPLPGTQKPASADAEAAPDTPENPGETAVREAGTADADPVSTTVAAGAHWMQRDYELFNAHQERNRQAFGDQQRIEQERFAAYQRAQLEQFMKSQESQRNVFRHHREARSQMWRQDLRQVYGPGSSVAPPPPPWWRKR